MNQRKIVDSRLNDEVGPESLTGQLFPRGIAFDVPGNPQPQERPRVRAYIDPKTGHARAQVYARKGKTKNYRAMIAHEAAIKMDGRQLLQGPLDMTVVFYLEKPKSKPKYKVWPDVRPDLDNYVKAVKDALKGVVYRDDSQIVRLEARKMYAAYGPPRTKIAIEELKEAKRHV